MSRGPENKFWDALRPRLALAGIRSVRVENMLEDGFPDVVCQCKQTHITLLELKARTSVPVSQRSLAMGADHGLRLSQRNWWLEYNNFGGRRGLIVSRVGGLVFAHSAVWADQFNGWTFAEFCDEALADSYAGIAQLIQTKGWA